MSEQNFLQRLKQRKLVQWAVAYVAAAFALLQGADIIAQRFAWPEQTMRFVIIALSIGLFVTVVLAWYHGERGAQRVSGTELLILALLLALGGGFLWHFASGSREPAGKAVLEEKTTTTVSPIPAKSIAVLPFENLSDDKANAYFASGIQDEILTRLSKIGALKVISRSSTKQYESKPVNLREVGQQLDVANLLEGSVQKAGDVVHINVQLIRAASDEHLWAESYNRKLDDIFAVQAEVAGAIGEALNAKLTGAEQKAITARPTNNPAAYDAYLRGLDAEHQPFGPEKVAATSQAFAQAVKLDPNFALAWAHGSFADGLLYAQALDRSAERLAAARHGAEMAMRLAPETAEAWLAKGYFLYRTQDYAGALTALEEAGKHSPNNPEVLAARAFVERRRGKFEKSIELMTAALERDPRNVGLITELANTLIYMRRPAEARRWLDRALSIQPGALSTVALKARSYLAEGNFDAAGQLLDPLPPQLENGVAFAYQIEYRDLRRDWGWIISAVRQMRNAPGFQLDAYTGGYYAELGWAQRRSGDEAGAQETFKEGREKLEALRAKVSDNGYIAARISAIEAGLGNCDSALREAQTGVDAAGDDRFDRSFHVANLAGTQALCGRKEEALATLSRIAQEPISIPLASLRAAADWDSLRDDPRFQKLIADAEAAVKAQPGK